MARHWLLHGLILPMVAFCVGSVVLIDHLHVVDGMGSSPSITRPAAKGSPEWLMDKHNCWSGVGPAGVIPGHAVVRRGDADDPAYVGGAQASQALQQAVADGPQRFAVIYGFCR